VDAHGLHTACFYDGGARSFYTLRKPILGPGDIKGMTLRVMESRTSEEMIATLGGIPSPIPYADVLPALEHEWIDGAENNPPSFYTSGHYQTARYYSLDEHTRVPDLVVFNRRVWDDLTPQARLWIEQAAKESVSYELKLWREQTQDALKQIEKAGVLIYHPDKAAFAAAIAPMYTKLDGTRLGELARRIMIAD
jgi:TRAP-type C4-dicarboxylate transport system substrate-binding protein